MRFNFPISIIIPLHAIYVLRFFVLLLMHVVFSACGSVNSLIERKFHYLKILFVLVDRKWHHQQRIVEGRDGTEEK